MSLAALLHATRSTLRSAVTDLGPGNSGVNFDGRPPASSAAPIYLAIHPTAWKKGPSEDIHEAIEEEYGIALSLSYRTSVIPRDRWGEEAYLEETRSLEGAGREVLHAMHGYRYDLISLANDYLGLDTTKGWQILEPLMYQGTPMAPTPMTADWFHAQPDDEIPTLPDGRRKDMSGRRRAAGIVQGAAEPIRYHGLLMVLEYFGGRRIIPSLITGYWVRVALTVTRDDQPALSGTYGGNPDSITVQVNGTDYTPDTIASGHWSITQGTIAALSPGTYDVAATAVYDGGRVTSTDATVDELTIIDSSGDWLWSGGEYSIWSTGQRSVWTS